MKDDVPKESIMFGETFAAIAMFTFGAMLKRAVDIKNQGHHPPKPTRVVNPKVDDEGTVASDGRTVIPDNEALMRGLQQRRRGDASDIIDAEDAEDTAPPEQ